MLRHRRWGGSSEDKVSGVGEADDEGGEDGGGVVDVVVVVVADGGKYGKIDGNGGVDAR
jgi:hypothetical protein